MRAVTACDRARQASTGCHWTTARSRPIRPSSSTARRAVSDRSRSNWPASQDGLEDVGAVDVVIDVVIDVLGGESQRRSVALLRPGGTLVSVADLAERVRSCRLRVLVGDVFALDDAVSGFTHRGRGKTVIRVVDPSH